MLKKIGFVVLAALLVTVVAVANTSMEPAGSSVAFESVSAELGLLGAGTLAFGGGGGNPNCNQCLHIGTCPMAQYPPPQGWCGNVNTSPNCACGVCNGRIGCY